jgi:hypothetical protein
VEADEAADIEEVQAWAAGLEALHACIAGRFARADHAGGSWPTCAACWVR